MNTIAFKKVRQFSEFVCSDGGRAAAGFKERNDCSVRALVHVSGAPYEKVHAICAKYGRKPGRGMKIMQPLLKISEELNIRLVSISASGTVGKFIANHATDLYLVRVRGHIFAVSQGAVYDTVQWSPLRRIRNVWQVVAR